MRPFWDVDEKAGNLIAPVTAPTILDAQHGFGNTRQTCTTLGEIREFVCALYPRTEWSDTTSW